MKLSFILSPGDQGKYAKKNKPKWFSELNFFPFLHKIHQVCAGVLEVGF